MCLKPHEAYNEAVLECFLTEIINESSHFLAIDSVNMFTESSSVAS